MNLIINHGDALFKDTIKACMTVTSRLVPRIEPNTAHLDTYIQSLSILSQHSDPMVSASLMNIDLLLIFFKKVYEPVIKCFMTLTDRFIRRGSDLKSLTDKGLIQELTKRLASASDSSSPQSVSIIVNLLSALIRGSAGATHVSACIYTC